MYVNFTTDRCTKRCVSFRLWRIWSLSFPLFLFASLQVSVAASRPDAKGAPGIAMAKVALQQQVSGQVTDSTSQPLEGVSVKVKDGQATAVTDGSGRFAINVPNNDATLVFTFVGYANQEVAIQGRSTISVTMVEERSELNEVVVVGYGTQRRNDVTGSIVSVSAEEIEARPVNNVLEAMQGKAAGVDITSSKRPGRSEELRVGKRFVGRVRYGWRRFI